MSEESLIEEVQHLAELLHALDKQNKKLRAAVIDVGQRKGTCWCGVLATANHILHTVACDDLFLALYGAERGE